MHEIESSEKVEIKANDGNNNSNRNKYNLQFTMNKNDNLIIHITKITGWRERDLNKFKIKQTNKQTILFIN